MDNCENRKEILLMLSKVTNFVENTEKLEMENDQLKFENENFKNQFEEANLRIQELNEQLLQREKTISHYIDDFKQKDAIIAKQDKDLKQKEAIIAAKNEQLQQNKAIIAMTNEKLMQANQVIDEYKADLMDLNEIIDSKELAIIQKEDLVEEKIDLIRNQDLQARELNLKIAELDQKIQMLEKESIKSTEPSNPARCKDLELKIDRLEEYINCLHDALERSNIFGDLQDVDVEDDTICVADDDVGDSSGCDESNEVDREACEDLDSSDEFFDVHVDFYNRKTCKKTRINNNPIKSSFAKKATNKKLAKRIKKKVRFSKAVFVATF